MIHTFTANYRQSTDGLWWIGTVEEVPGAISQERTVEETRASLVEAVQLILEVNREYAAQEAGDAPVVREPLLVERSEMKVSEPRISKPQRSEVTVGR